MKQKRYIILLTIIFLLLLIIYIFIGKDYIKSRRQKMTLIVGNSSVFLYEHNQWTNKKNINEIYWDSFILYDDNKKIGKYQVWKDNEKWLYFDKNKTEKETSGKTLAVKSNYNIKVDSYKEIYLNENDDNINYVLKDNNINLNTNIKSRYKIDLDFDNDETIETFYIISNAFSERKNNEKLFSIGFMIKNNKLYYLYKSIESNKNFYQGCLPYYNYFININDTIEDEIILSCGKYSNNKTIDTIYQFDKENNKFKELVSNR